MRSLFDNILPKHAVGPSRITGTGTPTAQEISGIDTQGYNTGVFNIQAGTATGTAMTYVISAQVQDSADNSTFTDVAGKTGTIQGTTTSVNLIATIRLEGLGIDYQRYVRVIPTVTMTPNDGSTLDVSADCILARGFQDPPGASASVDDTS